MKPLNTIPIESFLEKSKIAIRSGQKSMVMDIKDVQALNDSLAIAMTRLAGVLDATLEKGIPKSEAISIKMDGGGF